MNHVGRIPNILFSTQARNAELVALPRVVVGRNRTRPAGGIPRVVIQTFKTRVVPRRLADAVATWTKTNPEYDHRLFDDADAAAFVRDTYGADSREFRALGRAPSGAQAADLFRYPSSAGVFF